jgi:L-cystine uptake protein TcyP (sodium:dicarboxylate symporter family)
MRPVDAPAATDDASLLRRSLVSLVVIAICGLTAELLVERHWGTPVRLVPWFALVALAYAALLLMRRPTAAAVRRARMLAGAVMIAAVVGVALHINENYVAGPLDQRYEQLWAGMSEVERWWAAFSKAVGPAPTFAPAALALVSLVLLVATQRHPALRA